MPIRAITFDFWNTLYRDTEKGLSRVTELRMGVLREVAEGSGAAVAEDKLAKAYRAGFEEYLSAWSERRQFGAHEHTTHVLAALGVEVGDGLLARTATRLEELGSHAELALLPGAAETIPELSRRGIKLGVISDTGVTPGRVLAGFLKLDGLHGHFSAFTFSDATGYTKPDPRAFERTLAELDTLPSEALHVGDLSRTDVAGALEAGMVAVRMAYKHDDDDPPAPHAVIRDHRELLPLLAVLGNGGGRRPSG